MDKPSLTLCLITTFRIVVIRSATPLIRALVVSGRHCNRSCCHVSSVVEAIRAAAHYAAVIVFRQEGNRIRFGGGTSARVLETREVIAVLEIEHEVHVDRPPWNEIANIRTYVREVVSIQIEES